MSEKSIQEERIRSQLGELQRKSGAYRTWGNVVILRAVTPELEIAVDGYVMNEDYSALYRKIFARRPGITSILVTRQENGSAVRETIPAILDDQAQLLGPSLRFVSQFSDDDSIYQALKGRFAVNLGNGMTLCIGKNLEESYVAAQLVEKTAKAFLEARPLGGAKRINRLEAWAMHKFYMLKYSKESEKNRIK